MQQFFTLKCFFAKELAPLLASFLVYGDKLSFNIFNIWYHQYMKRQEFWKEKGYTIEQIECHLSFERRKSKESRERNKKNNKDNLEIIKKIKGELLGKTFSGVTITKINETNDGKGFWYHCFRKFSDGSSGNFRYFCRFDDYVYEDFIKDINL